MADDSRTVLVVDDEADAREFVITVLEGIGGLNIITAEDGDAGERKAAEIIPDLMLLDVTMPGKTGFEVFAALRNNPKTADIPIAMLTGVSERMGKKFREAMGEYLGREPDAFLDKSVDPEELKRRVKEILGI